LELSPVPYEVLDGVAVAATPVSARKEVAKAITPAIAHADVSFKFTIST
jgi:hypothetical protein